MIVKTDGSFAALHIIIIPSCRRSYCVSVSVETYLEEKVDIIALLLLLLLLVDTASVIDAIIFRVIIRKHW